MGTLILFTPEEIALTHLETLSTHRKIYLFPNELDKDPMKYALHMKNINNNYGSHGHHVSHNKFTHLFPSNTTLAILMGILE